MSPAAVGEQLLVPVGVHAVVANDSSGGLSVAISAESEGSRAALRERATRLKSIAAGYDEP